MLGVTPHRPPLFDQAVTKYLSNGHACPETFGTSGTLTPVSALQFVMVAELEPEAMLTVCKPHRDESTEIVAPLV